jgi:cysteine desulfurase
MKPQRIYLDYNATAPLRPEAAAIWAEFASTRPAQNPSSLHWAGQLARKRLRLAREELADQLDCKPSELVFTSGGSESNSLALQGTAIRAEGDERDEVWASAIEHPSVMGALQQIAALPGNATGLLPVLANGGLDLAAAARRIGSRTRLVSLMLANNETGAIQPVREVVELAHAAGALVHCDATQAVGKMSFAARALGVDLLSLGGHKFGAGPGFGLLFVRTGLELRPLFPGHQQDGRRAGTESVVAIAAAAAAMTAAIAQLPENAARMSALRDRLEQGLLKNIAGCWVNGAGMPRLCNTLNIGFEGAEGEALVIALDLEGIAASSGAACASGTLEPSGVLSAMGQDPVRASAAVRFSLGPDTTAMEIDRVLEVMPAIVAANRRRHGTMKETADA